MNIKYFFGEFCNDIKSLFVGSKKFKASWTKTFLENPESFSGLYGCLWDISKGNSKKMPRVYRELCQRVENSENTKTAKISKLCLEPLIDSGNIKAAQKYSALLIEAAKAAGIERDCREELIIDENNITWYSSLDENDFNTGDKVKVRTGAWLKNGKLIESGTANFAR